MSKKKRTVLIAGATGNVGGGAALELARRGVRVVMLGRNEKKLTGRAQTIREKLRADDPAITADIETLEIDFADLECVRRVAERAANLYPEIDAIILSVVALKQNGPNILPNGHEIMFSTNVLGPFLFAQLLIEPLENADGMVLHVVAPFQRDIDWNDLESIKHHKPMAAYERTKTYNRVIAGEMARRYKDRITSVAFDPSFIIDKTDPDLAKRWPSGFAGLYWRIFTMMAARPPKVAGTAIADLVSRHTDRQSLNGAYFKLNERRDKSDDAMNDTALGSRLWATLERLTAPDGAQGNPGE